MSPASASSAGSTTRISAAGTSSPQTGELTPSGSGDSTQAEFAGRLDEAGGPGPYPGTITDKSLSDGTGHGASVTSGRKAKSQPEVHHRVRRPQSLPAALRTRRQPVHTVEPPDLGLCVGHGYELEAVHEVLTVFDSFGQSALADNTTGNIVSELRRNVNHAVDLNSFFGYTPAIVRATGVRGPSLTDPSCLYDAATHRWFVTVLTLESLPNGALTHVDHLDTAVSNTADGFDGSPDLRLLQGAAGSRRVQRHHGPPRHLRDGQRPSLPRTASPAARPRSGTRRAPGGATTGAAAVSGRSVWIASDYIAHACDETTWGGRFLGATTGDNLLGTCASAPGDPGLRTALGNWSTRISKFTP